jgi:hypothetical protein
VQWYSAHKGGVFPTPANILLPTLLWAEHTANYSGFLGHTFLGTVENLIRETEQQGWSLLLKVPQAMCWMYDKLGSKREAGKHAGELITDSESIEREKRFFKSGWTRRKVRRQG